ncbi:MAG: Nucleotidyltransferase domain protein [Planctomycetes bacterium ADurb.Bin126]|nr:MAG: Nucleotidyltransferase domain protein [Planctomycetes bacterium ADurb.Bin126]HOD83972.1 nucleotidyltransferase domain-containing protein [Phycisphaerae bacterium]HQL72501.1 nucleotidyltransferase domain-containing protein [Phycisphaerae bacterium]
MVLSRDKAVATLRDLRAELEKAYGDRLRRVCLYGSYARDEATEDSDIDIAVVLRGPVNRVRERHRMAAVVSDFSLRNDCLMTVFFLSEEEYLHPPFAVQRSIVREGVEV